MSMNNKVVKFQFDRANNPSMKERLFNTPGIELIDMTIGTVIEINFENDAYYADFKIDSKQVNQLKNNEGDDITEYVYVLKYIPKTTKTKSEMEKIQEKVSDEIDVSKFINGVTVNPKSYSP